MAYVGLLASPEQHGKTSSTWSSGYDDDDDDDDDTSTFDSEPPQYRTKPSKFTQYGQYGRYHVIPMPKIPNFLLMKDRRLRVAVIGFGSVVALCLCLALIIPHLGGRGKATPISKGLSMDHTTNRELSCTTWSDDQIKQSAREWTPSSLPPTANSSSHTGVYRRTKPEGFKIVAMIFFGRRETVDILDCYLRQNLISRGGYLDEVHFVVNPRDLKDTDWLRDLLKTGPDEYKEIPVPERCHTSIAWTGCLWDLAADRNTLYLKIDDDILYFAPDTIPSIVETRLREKEAFAISANVVNSIASSWTHYHNGAVHPYLPEPDVREVEEDRGITWRPSEMPEYPEEVENFITRKKLNHFHPPYQGHRWLRLHQSGNDSRKTPISLVPAERTPDHTEDIARHWAVDAQMQYSLLENIEQNQLGKYYLGGSDGIWHSQFHRYNINFVAVWGSDVADNLPFDTHAERALDEALISFRLPAKLGRPFLIDSHATVLHWSFHWQRNVDETDLLDRWRAYANELVCEEYKKPFGEPCKGVGKEMNATLPLDVSNATA